MGKTPMLANSVQIETKKTFKTIKTHHNYKKYNLIIIFSHFLIKFKHVQSLGLDFKFLITQRFNIFVQ